MKNFIAALALAACPLTTVPEFAVADTITLTDKDLNGGDISYHYNRVQDFNARGISVRLDAQAAISAGTFYLMVNDSCVVRPRMILEYHGPSHNIRSILTGHDGFVNYSEKREWVVGQMRDFYNSKYSGMGDWFYECASQKRGMLVCKTRASELSRVFGVRICEE